MKHYSIVRIGNEYVVQVDHKSVLKTASKRSALRLIRRAAELLEAQSASVILPVENREPTIAPEDSEVS